MVLLQRDESLTYISNHNKINKTILVDNYFN
jgi:hypothetical protein